ncbi:sigma 54-interacting transcriptional regulator [Clostridium sp.]|uniref:sigma 54-interacting transcriptional regulator n=1 Tax=Clostridium sp. TaxID=1506 RepID=UPI0025C5E033|nr:sigma 54-interacting transcriptional regulator [Clostridium sp.]
MLRIELINKFIKDFCSSLSVNDIRENPTIGISSLDIVKGLNILRNNASSDLNKLYKAGLLIKIKGKPTKYFNKDYFEGLFDLFLEDEFVQCSSLNDLIPHWDKLNENETINTTDLDPFNKLIGSNHSLSGIVKLAKSSILYPNGLHTILLGESGVGKSLFAEIMYEYGIQNNIFSKNSSFIVFNCADYANNPNLLVAQLFGSLKGSYTGADNDKKGLIEEADGGVLFLDEIHRLPPEGQEMLFMYIDKKKFRRLGETSSERTAKVLIIAATTESTNSTLLTTFLRRIPSTIRIPSLKDRTLSEKLMLVTTLYSSESKKINMPIHVNKDCLSDLMLYNPHGNIGQLASDIQLSVARSYLDSRLNNLNKVHVTRESLPLYTSNTPSNIDISTRQKVELLLDKDEYKFLPESKIFKIASTPSYDFVKFYNNQLNILGEDKTDIKKVFSDYTQLIAKKLTLQRMYPDFLDDEISGIVSTLSDILYDELNLIIDRSTYTALALYLKNLKDYTIDGHKIPNSTELLDIPLEIQSVCKKLVKILEVKFNIYCPTQELNNLMVIIDSLKSKEISDCVGIMIAAHGDSLASNIAAVANELLSINFALAVDMPLTENASNVLPLFLEKLKAGTFKRGVILFADMGSLVNLDIVIKEKTGIDVVTVNSTNILLVIEAVRKSIFLKSHIDDILHDLIEMNNKLSYDFNRKIENHLSINKKRLIYTVCNSGEGIAHYLHKNLLDILKDNNIYDIEIIPLNLESITQLRDIIHQTSVDKKTIAIVGSINPNTKDIPFISLEDIVLHNGVNKLLSLIGVKNINIDNRMATTLTKDITINITCDTVDKYLTIFSANKIKPLIFNFINAIEESLDINMTNSSITKIFIHLSCAIERIFLKDFILTPQEEMSSYIINNEKFILVTNKALEKLNNSLNITIPTNELYYICEIVKDAYAQSKSTNLQLKN